MSSNDYGLEDDCLTVLEQSSLSEPKLPLSQLSQEDQPGSNDDSRSDQSPIPILKPPSDSLRSKKWVQNDLGTKMPVDKSKSDTALTHSERSWSGSPDWDFKEGCSYDVQNYRTSGGAISILRDRDQSVFVPFLRESSSERLIRQSMTRRKQRNSHRQKSRSADCDCVDEEQVFISKMPENVTPTYLDCSIYCSGLSKRSEGLTSHRVGYEDLGNEMDSRSFLNRAKNEFELFEDFEEDQVEEEDLGEYDLEDMEGYPEETPLSRLGSLLSVAVGIGAGAIFQILK